ncbi:TM2 domain-containing protein [Jannaschia sp. S6380]|uniref:TM2 domain-containing protein n=1 Tax=Jannaschia sp. S6380 TaxID=2926408 RepID=UPI001FF4CD23|nr:TM2 domain-containing protein [Jannaschia sp. S6380]MCK0166136.1 TM2 domain-containing protein [Jannaschia sp. S6380]
MHRFYLGRIGSDAFQLGLFLVGFLTLGPGVGFLLVGILLVWVLADTFLMPGIARRDAELRRAVLMAEALAPG